MNLSKFFLLIGLCLSIQLLAPITWADTDIRTGVNGSDGVGAANGGDGGPADAYVSTSLGDVTFEDIINTAIGTGGKGGNSDSGRGGTGGPASATAKGRNGGYFSNVFVSATSTGGQGGDSNTGPGGAGGSATATSRGEAFYFSLSRAYSTATGGQGGAGQIGGAGGDAVANTYAASGPFAPPTEASGQATGGDGGSGHSLTQYGRGGNATSSTTAISNGSGDAQLQVHDLAVGGNGSTGGNASSSASGVLNASGEIIATASGGNSVKPGGPGGDASALASGSGGTISAQATAGGQGAAQAHATLNWNTGGNLKANAATSGLQALASSPFVYFAELETRTAVATPAPDRSLGSGLNAFAFATAKPLAADVAAALAGNPKVTSQFFGSGSSTMLGLATMGGALSADAYFEDYHSSFTQTIDLGTLPNLKHLLLGLVNPEFGGNTNYLHFLVTENGSSFIDETFADAATALAYFTDHAVDLGDFTGLTGSLDLGLAFDFTPGNNASFSTQLLLGAPGLPSPTPLPASLLLLASGLAGLASRSVYRGCKPKN